MSMLSAAGMVLVLLFKTILSQKIGVMTWGFSFVELTAISMVVLLCL